MAAIVNMTAVQFGGASNQVGVFSGQNQQNVWDANSPNLSAGGTTMGQGVLKIPIAILFQNHASVGQPIFDNDIKDNTSAKVQS